MIGWDYEREFNILVGIIVALIIISQIVKVFWRTTSDPKKYDRKRQEYDRKRRRDR